MTTTLHPVPVAVPPRTATPRSRGVTWLSGLGARELAVLGFALLLPLAFVVQAFMSSTTPKFALLLAITGPGLVVLALACRAGDRAAWWAAAFLGAAALATVFSAAPALSLFGGDGWFNGLIFVAAIVAAWALGRSLSVRSRELLLVIVLATALVNAVFAWLQSVITLGPIFHLYDGRTPGLMGNPVQLGALCAGALWLAAVRTRTQARSWLGCLAVAVLGGALQLSGSRIALAAGVVAVVVAAVRMNRRRAFAVLAALALGCVLAMAVPTGGSSSTERASSAGGLGPRVALWGDAATALVDRPVLGYGPGRFASAVGPHFSVEVARYTGGDTQYADAHNFIVDYATTTGLVGLVLLVGWLVASGRRARGPLVGFVLAVGASMLFEPQYVGLTPLVALALGASGPALTRPVLGARAKTIVGAVCVVTALAGAAVGAAIVAGDVAYFDGVKGASLSAIDRADGLLPPWPEVAGRRAVIAGALRVITGEPRYLELARVAAADAVRRDPENPQFLNLAGSVAEATGHRHEADRRYGEALTRNPWSTRALFGRYRIAVTDHRYAAANVFRHRLCELGKDACAPPPKVYERELAKAAKAAKAAKSTKVPKN